jgi:hypothetical protein
MMPSAVTLLQSGAEKYTPIVRKILHRHLKYYSEKVDFIVFRRLF